MVKQVVNIGTVELRGRDGDTNRVANEKFQANHNETYKALGADGEGNLPTALPIENGGTGATTATNARENLDVDSRAETTQKIKDNVVNNLTAGGTENALSAEMGKNLQSNKLDKTANAVSASKLFTARSFTWTGDVTGSVNFDGSANVTNALTLSNTGVAAGAYGSNIKTVTLTLDAKGRVTAASQQDIRAATTALSGVVQLNDTLTSTLITQAATANAVKKVNDAVLATDIIAKAAIPSSQKGMANGVATLDSSGVIPANQLPSYVDDVLEFATQAAFPATGETGKIYISIETGMTYRWTGTVYAPIGGGAGTADSALKLFSPRTIALSGGVTGTATQFDGSANIIIPITEVDASKITKGTIPAARIPTLNQSTTGNAATATTATKLATARKINGIDFDGTGNINLDVYSQAEVDAIFAGTSATPDATETTAGIAKIATTAIAQAGTNDTDIITAKKLRAALSVTGNAPMYACRAWASFNGVGVVAINSSGNVSSITDLGVGTYQANLTVAMPHANYAGTYGGTLGANGTDMVFINIYAKTTTSFKISVFGLSLYVQDPFEISVGVIC